MCQQKVSIKEWEFENVYSFIQQYKVKWRGIPTIVKYYTSLIPPQKGNRYQRIPARSFVVNWAGLSSVTNQWSPTQHFYRRRIARKRILWKSNPLFIHLSLQATVTVRRRYKTENVFYIFVNIWETFPRYFRWTITDDSVYECLFSERVNVHANNADKYRVTRFSFAYWISLELHIFSLTLN